MTRKTLAILFAIGRPLSPFYSLLMRVRAFLYERGVLKATQLPVPVISIGNLTMGGSGKTPMVLYVAELLKKNGVRSIIVSRGYGGQATKPVNVVSDGRNILLDAHSAGDEPRMLAEALPGVPVITGAKKAEVAAQGIADFAPGIVILDDGFQHLALKRDINLVLFNSRMPLGNGRVFPGGDLREQTKALRRAHAFVITGADAKSDTFKKTLTKLFPEKPVFEGRYAYTAVLHSQKPGKHGPSFIKGMKLYGFCGIANPTVFEESLDKMGVQVVGFAGYQDHYNYQAADIARLAALAESAGAEGLIATEKDYVKLAGLIPQNMPVLALQRRVVMTEEFDRFVLERLGQV